MKRLSLVLMVALLAAVVATPVQALQLDNMDNIAARPWTDLRDPGEGTGWLSQGPGHMKIDYGVTNDSSGVPDPTSGYDYLGSFVGVGAAGGAFDVNGVYKGRYDREIQGIFTLGVGPGLMPILNAASDAFHISVYKTVAGYSEHVRELQLYDSGGARNTYSVQAEATADATPQGWSQYTVYLKNVLENNADLTDIVDVRFFVSAWSAYVTAGGTNPYDPITQPALYAAWPAWPTDYTLVPKSGTPVLIDNLTLVPEPATIAMLSLGGLALLRRRKKA